MKCMICKADYMVNDRSTYIAQLPNCYVIIENVPCRKCTQCGEVVYATSVMEKIDELLKKVEAIASKILIMDYDQAV